MSNTVIGSTITIEGEITSDEALVVQGTIKGKVNLTRSLYVENSATVEADIEADSVEVDGTVVGNIDAGSRVEIKDGKMTAMQSPRILIADVLDSGSIDMDVGR